MTSKQPAELAAALERSAELPEGSDERFVGYGVMAAPFSSGHLLAMRRFVATSIGRAYTSVWHRSPAGEWTIYSDPGPALEACPRYFGSALTRALETGIDLSWPAPTRMEISVPAAGLEWSLELEQTIATRFMNQLGRSLSERMWRSAPMLSMMSKMASALLHAGRLGLTGRLPNGQAFLVNPMMVWSLREAHAVLAGRDLGRLAPLAEQARLGDFWLPQRGLFAFGRAFFEPFDARRHVLVSQMACPVERPPAPAPLAPEPPAPAP